MPPAGTRKHWNTTLGHWLPNTDLTKRVANIEPIRPEFRETIIADLNWIVDRVLTRVSVYDTILAARWEKLESGREDAARLETEISAMLEIINYQEETTYWRAHELGIHTEPWERKGVRK